MVIYKYVYLLITKFNLYCFYKYVGFFVYVIFEVATVD